MLCLINNRKSRDLVTDNNIRLISGWTKIINAINQTSVIVRKIQLNALKFNDSVATESTKSTNNPKSICTATVLRKDR
jgi:hypothetical protein